MTNAPDTRQTHVIRILGTNRNGDVLSDIWADVERIDIAKSATVDSGGFWQGVQRKLKWMDDPNADDYNPDGNPARVLEIIKVCDPQNTANVNDPDEWIPVPVIRSLKSKEGDAGTQDRQRNNGPDDSGDLNAARVSEPRRIYHYDTSIDAAASAAFDADPTLKVYVVQGSSYSRNQASQDTSQYVEHEIVTYLKASGNSDAVDAQRQQVKLLNQYLIDESAPAQFDVTGRDGINPPYRLDVFQNIINVQFKSLKQQWVLGISNTMANGSFNRYGSFDTLTADGTSRGGTIAGCSGMGYAVFSEGPIAFGTIKLADGSTQSVFLRADVSSSDPTASAAVYLGTVSGGALSWSQVWTAPAEVLAISYANDKFFVTYVTGSDIPYNVALAVTGDGSTFTTGINPFPSVPGDNTNNQNNFAGNVAYNKTSKTYAIVGSHFNDDPTQFNIGLCWGTSSDGLSWSSGYVGDPVTQPGSTTDIHFSTLCAGNGVFVAAASKRHTFSDFSSGDPYDLHSCAIATSVNGASWTLEELPGAVVRSDHDLGDRAGDTYAVAFVQDKAGAQDGNGYFVACGFETGGVELINTSKLWKGSPVSGFTLIKQQSYDFSGTQSIYGALSVVDKTLPSDPSKIIIV